MKESDSEYEEEEFLVFADFKSHLVLNDMEQDNIQFKMIGAETDNPIAEVNGFIFKGTYDYSMGTHVFFEEDEDAPELDPLYDKPPKRLYKFCGKTNKVLNFSRTFVEPETDQMNDVVDIKPNQKSENAFKLEVDTTYEQALKQL